MVYIQLAYRQNKFENLRLDVKMKEYQQNHESSFARASGVCMHFKIAKSTLWLWLKTRPGFPKPIRAGARVTLFDLKEIEKFLRAQNDIDAI